MDDERNRELSTDYGPMYSQSRAIDSFRRDPERAMAGTDLISPKMDEEMSPAMILVNMDSERFVELISSLPPVIQDIFLQYYLLGRTYDQIGAVLFPQKPLPARRFAIHTGNRLGLRALCATIQGQSASKDLQDASRFRGSRGMVKISCPPSFESFAVTPNGDLPELFAPSWSVAGCRGSGVRALEC
jgi:hypothetical protein